VIQQALGVGMMSRAFLLECAMLVGTPKLKNMQTFSSGELKELFSGMENYLNSGVPMEVPAAIPIGQLGRIVSTLQRYHELVDKVAHLEAGIECPGMDRLMEAWDKMQSDAKELIEVKPPEQPKIVAAPQSRLIIPK
jgi:hypothetical protein